MPQADTSAILSDEDLGVGVEDAAPSDPLAALLADPRMAEALDKLIAQRVAQMAAPAASDAPHGMDALAKTLGHMIEVNAQQQPGYIKPLPADEVDRRLAGRVEMFALLEDYERRGLTPRWLVGEGGFFECTNAEDFKAGEPIATYLPPAEDFIPQNEFAANVHAAMKQWLGVPTEHIGEQVEAAQRERNQPRIVTGALQPDRKPGLVQREGAAAPKPVRRTMGGLLPERHDVSLAERAAGAAVGPQFEAA